MYNDCFFKKYTRVLTPLMMDISKLRLRDFFSTVPALRILETLYRVSIKFERVKLFSTDFPKPKLLSNSEKQYRHSSLTQY